ISDLAPTSMPRVGSSMMRMRGSAASHFASTTFCWLPPESWRAGWSGPRALIPSRLMKSRARLCSLRRSANAPPGKLFVPGGRNILGDGLRPDKALEAAILRHIGDAEIARLLRRPDLHRFAVDQNLARGCGRNAEDRERRLGAPRADKAGHAHDLAGAQREGD